MRPCRPTRRTTLPLALWLGLCASAVAQEPQGATPSGPGVLGAPIFGAPPPSGPQPGEGQDGAQPGTAPLGAAPLGSGPQRGAPGPGGAPPSASLQNQLGAIPLISPRATTRTAMVRSVRVTQFSADNRRLGEPVDMVCPESGCQQLLTLVVDRGSQSFLADVQFVSHGAYVALQPRSLAVGGVMDFNSGRPGPVFLKGPPTTVLEKRISFVLAPAASVRALDGTVGGRSLSSGPVYTRKLEPDLVLKVEISPPRPAN